MVAGGSGNTQEHWSGQAAFVLAAVGSAVGLGNLVRFPAVAGENGGGAFVLIYLACIALIGLPVLMAELVIGRRGGGSAIAAVSRLAHTEGSSRLWALFPAIGALASFLILSYYSVLAGWVIDFVLFAGESLVASVRDAGAEGLTQTGFAAMTAEDVSGRLGELKSSPTRMLIMHGIFMAVTIGIVSLGVKSGIETAAKLLMPIFFVLLLVLTGFSIANGNFAASMNFLFAPDFSALSGDVILAAVGQAFFSLSLGSAMMITYGVYMDRREKIPSASNVVAVSDTMVALIAGLAIFPIVFAGCASANADLSRDPGLGLLFETVPLAFMEIPFGGVFALAFFIMALFAALTSAIALLEVSVAWFDGDVAVPPDVRARRRVQGAILLGGICFVIGISNALSQVPPSVTDTFFNTWQPIGGFALFEGMTMLGFIDTLTAKVFLPLGGVLTALFAGWVISSTNAREELQFKTEGTFKLWRTLVRWVAPIIVTVVFVNGAIVQPFFAKEASEAAPEQPKELVICPPTTALSDGSSVCRS